MGMLTLAQLRTYAREEAKPRTMTWGETMAYAEKRRAEMGLA